jgi:hypothetical protein
VPIEHRMRRSRTYFQVECSCWGEAANKLIALLGFTGYEDAGILPREAFEVLVEREGVRAAHLHLIVNNTP